MNEMNVETKELNEKNSRRMVALPVVGKAEPINSTGGPYAAHRSST